MNNTPTFLEIGRIAPMAEHYVEAVTVQVRLLLRPQLRVWCNSRCGNKNVKQWNSKDNGEN